MTLGRPSGNAHEAELYKETVYTHEDVYSFRY